MGSSAGDDERFSVANEVTIAPVGEAAFKETDIVLGVRKLSHSSHHCPGTVVLYHRKVGLGIGRSLDGIYARGLGCKGVAAFVESREKKEALHFPFVYFA